MKDPLLDNACFEENPLPPGSGEELFSYSRDVLGKHSPNPILQPTLLLLEQRNNTAAAWEEKLKEKLDDIGLLHSLAVLWYWSARVTEDKRAWLAALGYWCALTAFPDFWTKNGELDEQEGAEKREYVLARLRQGVRADQLAAELAGVEILRKAGLHLSNSRVLLGPVLLKHLNKVKDLGIAVEELIRQSPAEQRFLAVREVFSPYFSIRVLMDSGEFAQAQTVLDKLSNDEQQLDEIKELKLQLLVKQGRRLIKSGNLALGLERWGQALQSGEESQELLGLALEAEEHLLEAYESWPRLGRRDGIIELLDQWLSQIPNENLQEKLALLLIRRGRSAICAAEDLAVTSATDADKGVILDTLERGRRDIARSGELGETTAEQQLKVADRIIAEARYGVLDLSGEIKELARKACELMARLEWDEAIEVIHEARDLVVSGRPHVLDRFLADCQANKVKHTVESAFVCYQEGSVDRAGLRTVINRTREELKEAQELDMLNTTIDRTRQKVEDIIHQTGITISDDVYASVVKSDQASAANDWDESIRLLLDVFDSVGAKGAPRFLKKRLAAVLANRAGAYYDSVRTRTAPEGERRKLAHAARDDLKDAAFFDPENDVIQSTLERVEKTLQDLPDEKTAPVIEQANVAAESGAWNTAYDVLRTAIKDGSRPAPQALCQALAALLKRKAREAELGEKLHLLFEALLLDSSDLSLANEVERLSHDYAQSTANPEATETSLALALVHLQKGEWQQAFEPLDTVFPPLALLVRLARNNAILAPLSKLPGFVVLSSLPVMGCSSTGFSADKIDMALANSAVTVAANVISEGAEMAPLRKGLLTALDCQSSLSSVLEAADNKDFPKACQLFKELAPPELHLQAMVYAGLEQVYLLHRVDTYLQLLRRNEVEADQKNNVLNEAKRLLVTASAIETASPHRVETMMRFYDETIELLGEDSVAVSTFAEDTFWWWFIAITTAAGLVTLVYYLL